MRQVGFNTQTNESIERISVYIYIYILDTSPRRT
jgi:hypothetical protein